MLGFSFLLLWWLAPLGLLFGRLRVWDDIGVESYPAGAFDTAGLGMMQGRFVVRPFMFRQMR